jgi:hypothetical protein
MSVASVQLDRHEEAVGLLKQRLTRNPVAEDRACGGDGPAASTRPWPSASNAQDRWDCSHRLRLRLVQWQLAGVAGGDPDRGREGSWPRISDSLRAILLQVLVIEDVSCACNLYTSTSRLESLRRFAMNAMTTGKESFPRH